MKIDEYKLGRFVAQSLIGNSTIKESDLNYLNVEWDNEEWVIISNFNTEVKEKIFLLGTPVPSIERLYEFAYSVWPVWTLRYLNEIILEGFEVFWNNNTNCYCVHKDSIGNGFTVEMRNFEIDSDLIDISDFDLALKWLSEQRNVDALRDARLLTFVKNVD